MLQITDILLTLHGVLRHTYIFQLFPMYLTYPPRSTSQLVPGT